MKNRKRINSGIFTLALFTLVILFSSISCKDSGIKTEVIDGVKHIHNPAEPLKGTIDLELEETLRIDLAEQKIEDFVVYDKFWKDAIGNVYLYDWTTKKVFQFTNDGKFLGSFCRIGQGPGEFSQYSSFSLAFAKEGEIWAIGSRKIARFDMERNFIGEIRMADYYSPIAFFDENHFVGQHRKSEGEGNDMQLWNIISYVERSEANKDKILADYFRATNVGVIRVGEAGFAEDWATPRVNWIFDNHNKRVYTALNTEYKITAHDIEGEMLYVIDKVFKPVTPSMKEKEEIIKEAFQRVVDYILKGYPDTLCAIKNIKLLPNGYIAVYWISGIMKYTIDVYNPKGEFLYILNPPQGVSFDEAEFYEFGAALKEAKEDRDVYVEYTIKNLPEIFGNE